MIKADRQDLEAAIAGAVECASINPLRIALYHQTRDRELVDVEVTEFQLRGGALSIPVVDRKAHAMIQDKAAAYLRDLLSDATKVKPNPTFEETRDLLTLYSGKAPTESELHYAFEEMAFELPPRDTVWRSQVPLSRLAGFKVTIIGSGVSGMAMAIQLGRLGIDYQIIERHSGLGGTWFLNDYPEARVDVPSFGYQYKFEQDYAWKHFYAPRDELLDYANYIADKYGVREKIRLSTELIGASWQEDSKQWLLNLRSNEHGETQEFSNVVISASGLFSTPKWPDIEGIDTFEGELFHTTAWDYGVDLQGKRIALIGTGSTGTQLARSLAEKAAKLTVFQRTPNWVTPVKGYHNKIDPDLQWLMETMPGYRSWFTYSNTASEFGAQDLHVIDREFVAGGGRVNPKNEALRASLTAFIRSKTFAKPELFQQLVPSHSPMSRRLVIDNGWYDTLMRENVDLVGGSISRFTEECVVDQGGQEHPADVIVLGAGFEVSRYTWPAEYRGREGTTLQEAWQHDGARAFKGMTVPSFPNFFVMYGPNAQLRAGTFHSVIEILARYISGLITHMVEQGEESIEVEQDAFDHYNSEVDEAMKELLWDAESGEGSYYVNEHKRVGVLAPWRLHEFYDMVREIDPQNYRFK